MKSTDRLTQQAAEAVLRLLQEVPFLQVEERPQSSSHQTADLEFDVRWPGGATTLVCEVRKNGQPAPARDAAARLRLALMDRPNATGVFVAPFISDTVATMCADSGISTIDLSGNARLTFGNVSIRHTARPNLFREKRELRSLFAPKASRILRVLLENPRESWPVQAIAREAAVSLGQVSAVKQALTDADWLAPGQFRLARPEEALRKWAEEQGRVEEDRVECYTSEPLEQAIARISAAFSRQDLRHALTGPAAAWRLAPMVPARRASIYIDQPPKSWPETLGLKPVPSGGNIMLMQPRDSGVFYKQQPGVDMPSVGAVQVYLDCMRSGSRGEEAAEAVLDQRLRPTW